MTAKVVKKRKAAASFTGQLYLTLLSQGRRFDRPS
jgi:hypothetical protein